MTFSGALTLTDLNDFITPSQACIKPVEQILVPEVEVQPAGAASTEIQIDASGAYHEVSGGTTGSNATNPAPAGPAPSTMKKLQKAEISLNDCLACSGCITSAETVLITMQSHVEVLSVLSDNPPEPSPAHRLPILSIAPQSLASLSASLGSSSPVSLRRILHRVRAFATQVLGFHRVYDTTFARHLTLLEHQREFLERRGCAKDAANGETRLPMLSSACPGWVCYAEKAHPEMIPFISRTKSPQQVMGTLVKAWLGGKWEKTPDQIYHVSVMPCYDKKLEASRKDFYSEAYATRDVDCVLTTGELQIMMEEKGWDLSKPVPGEDNVDSTLSTIIDSLPDLLQHPGSSSGSYLHSLLNSLTLSNPHKPLLLSTKTIRSSDYEEFVLKDTDTGEVVFKGAKCYGFRNLQNVVRKVGKEAGMSTAKGAAGVAAPSVALRGRRARAAAVSTEDSRGYDYVEVMACPSGCVNGGGQIRPPPPKAAQNVKLDMDEEGFARDWSGAGVPLSPPNPTPTANQWGDKAWTSRVESIYWREVDDSLPPTPPATPPSPSASSAVHARGEPDVGSSTAAIAVSAVGRVEPAPIVPAQLAAPQRSEADQLALRIVTDLCWPTSSEPGPMSSWTDAVPGEGEARRTELFRTQYHAVESSDVIGLTVQW